jgi:uncharacterized damage-inducible protein DinB
MVTDPNQILLAEQLHITEALKALPGRVASEIEGLSEEQLRFRPGAGEWSIKEVCGHLRDFAEINDRRLHRMATQERPLLPGVDQEQLARERNHQESDIEAVLEEFRVHRLRTVELLSELVHANWARQGRHEETGIISIRQMTEQIIAHEESHLEHIRALKAQAGVPNQPSA